MTTTFEAVVGLEPRTAREVALPAGVFVVPEKRIKGRRTVPDNPEMVEWLDHSTPGWVCVLNRVAVTKTTSRYQRVIIFETSDHAALFKVFWT